MEPKYVITSSGITRELEVAGSVNTDTREPVDFLQMLGSRVPFDTDFLPPGLRSYSQAGDHAQMVFVMDPAINMINWGENEGDRDAAIYRLAQPYRVIVASFVKGNLLGARMFYSPYPIASPDQPLYYQNVPNINCQGYNNTGIGWVCLYQNESWAELSVAERAAKIIERCSGVETYNNANMYRTDGPRFYKEMGKPDYVCDPVKWEEKTEAEGLDWVLDPDLWIPCQVVSQDSQLQHAPGGVPLTLRMVMDGMAPIYYDDRYQPKPDVALRREDLTPDKGKLFRDVVTDAFINSASTDPEAEAKELRAKLAIDMKKVIQKKSAGIYGGTIIGSTSSGISFTVDEWAPSNTLTTGATMIKSSCCEALYLPGSLTKVFPYGYICKGCLDSYPPCPSCETRVFEEDMPYHEATETYYCSNCYDIATGKVLPPPKSPDEVAVATGVAASFAKIATETMFDCHGCGGSFNMKIHEKNLVNLKSGSQYELCATCFEDKFICMHCEDLVQANQYVVTSDTQYICKACAGVCKACGNVVVKYSLDSTAACKSCVDPF